MIFYRWSSELRGAGQQPAVHARLFALILRFHGYKAWIDNDHLPIDSPHLRNTIKSELENTQLAIISIGPGDLKRCGDRDDFFRWEIETVRRFEKKGMLKVVIIVHGTEFDEDLICGVSTHTETRTRIKNTVGRWGNDILDCLKNHYVIYFDIGKADKIFEGVVSRLEDK